MAEIVVAVIAKLAEYLVDPLVRQGQYLFCASNITKTLETEKQKLASTQDGVQKHVREALNRTEKINDAVDKWLGEVKSHIDELQKLEQQLKESNSCFQGRCPTWRRYHLCIQMTEMIETTKNLNQRSEFNHVSITTTIPDIEYFSSGNFVYFQSTKLASDQLLAALQDDGIHMVGLYGMGGSGKTTLVKEVGKRAKELKLFDRVIFTTVSQNPDVGKIQNEIADLLGLRFDEQSEAGRVRRLFMRLSSEERILVILDDVWAMMNLNDVGIPFGDYGGCKILLTTRRQQVCNLMDCERKIPLHLLSEEESWTLFQKYARNVDESLASVAQGIVSECKGLPIAIQAVGASLRGKSIEEWKEALQRLRDSKPIDVEPGVRDAFSCLRLSYDYLRRKEAKSLFMMCCMYPEDANISVEELFRITIGLGMCEELGTLEDARNKVSASINHLVDSCLLMHSEKRKDHLIMHDTVRDVALWISSQENHNVIVNMGKDIVAVDGLIKDCYAFTSWCNQTSQFPQQLDAPKLEILLLTNIGECELSGANFKGMGALKVMQIDSVFYKPAVLKSLLPHIINLLPNLRTLRLQCCQLGDDLSWVLCLKGLEVLDLQYSSFKHLPQGLEELNKLKLLHTSQIKEQSFKVIERCIHLQELYASTIQLSRTTLNLDQCFSNDATFPRLKRYEVEIGNFDSEFYRDTDSIDFRCKALCLGGFKICTLSPFIKYLLQQVEAVYLYRFNGGCKNIVPDIVQVVGGMNELTSLWLHSCSDLECLADATSQHIDLLQVETLFFPKLIKLKLEDLANLKEIWCGPPLLCFFEKLQELYISHCPLLTSLFPKSVARALLLLQKLTIRGCYELLNIIEEDRNGSNNEITSASNNAYLVFSKLKNLCIIDCNKLQYIFLNSYVPGLEQLEKVYIDRASQLKYAFGQNENVHQDVQMKLPVLRSLQLMGLKNLLSIFPENFHSSCPCLRELHWKECPKFNASCVNVTTSSNTNMDNQYSRPSASLLSLNLEQLEIDNCRVEDILFAFEREDLTKRNSQNQLIPPLNTIKLKNLLELKLVWSGPMVILSLQNLKQFQVSGCNNLRTIFSPVILKSIPLLEHLEISDCNELEEIMSDIEVEEQHQGPPNAQSPKICFPNLQRLEVQRCNKLKCLFSVPIDLNNLSENILPNLRRLTLEEVPSLKDFCQGLSLSNDSLPQLLGSKLKELRLGSLSEVWLIWRAPSHILNLVHLEWLTLIGCNELEYVFGEGFHSSTLPKLECLRVMHCNKLKSLFSTSSVTLLFPHLYVIKISECEELEELFRHTSEASSSDTVNKILLPNLRDICLTELPSLVDICKGFKLSSADLADIHMSKCPKFSSIMGPTGSMRIDLKRKEAAEIDANGNQLLHQLPYLYPERLILGELELQELSELSFVCKAFTSFQNLSFNYLYDLTVKGCGKVKCILSMSVWGSLPQLRSLDIIECEQVEEIMQESSEEVSNSNMHYLSPFPELCDIIVNRCPKLKCLFRTATPLEMLLPQLRGIEVSEAAQMEELFSHNISDQETINVQQIELANLNTLELSKLPALTHFCKGRLNNFNTPYLHNVQINECPNFDFSFHQPTSSQTTG